MLHSKWLPHSVLKVKAPQRICHVGTSTPLCPIMNSPSTFDPWNYLSALFEMNNFGTNRKGGCDFLLVNNNYFGTLVVFCTVSDITALQHAKIAKMVGLPWWKKDGGYDYSLWYNTRTWQTARQTDTARRHRQRIAPRGKTERRRLNSFLFLV